MALTGVLKFFIIFLSSFASVEAACYYFDGTITNSDVPCLDGSDPSFCCSYGYACLSNGVCMATEQTPNATASFVRGSCTDDTWRDKNCPNFCLNDNDPNDDATGGAQDMDLCDGSNWAWYCLDNNVDAVSCGNLTNIALQSPDEPYVLTTIGFDDSTTTSDSSSTSSSLSSSASSGASSNTSSTTSLSSSSSNQTPSPTPNVAHFKSLTETVTFPTTKPASTTSRHVSAATASSKPPAKKTSEATIIGVAVGVGLAVIAAILVGFLLYRRRQKKGNSLVQRPDAPPEYYFNADAKHSVGHPQEVFADPPELETSGCYELENNMVEDHDHEGGTNHKPPAKYA